MESAAVSAAVVDEIAQRVDWDAALPPQAHTRRWRAGQIVKRALDIVCAAVGLALLSPFLLLLALAIRIDSSGAAIYPYGQAGYRGRRFTGYKFRTMVADADRAEDDIRHLNEMSGPVFKVRNDPRVTRLGRFLRKYSIDELPQLWLVLIGDMTLVGPRPLRYHEFVKCEPWHLQRFAVPAGITGLWQVSGRSAITSFDEWVELDLQYIRTWNLWLDFRILLRTIPVVLSGRNAY